MEQKRILNQKMAQPTSLERPERRQLLACALSVGSVLALGSSFNQHQRDETLSLTTEDRIALALMRFKMGFHCSQSLFEVYAEEFGIDPMVARRVAAALAGGSTVGG